MFRKAIKLILYVMLVFGLLASIAFVIVFQEFGPVDQEDLTQEKIRETNLVADFMYPKDGKDLPTILALNGSGGGFLPEKEMQALALNGYAVLSIAYFKTEGLPKKLEEIPLEYFVNAIDWVSKHSAVDSSKLILLGVSRGAELALLLASLNPKIKGVVAYAPGSLILPNAVDTEDSIATHSSWTSKGIPLPFAPLKVLQDDNEDVINYRNYIEPLLQKDNKERYTIKVENCKGPLLFLSGEDDQTWPSAKMATSMVQRLKDAQYPYPVHNVIYSNAGHWLIQFQNNYQIISSTFFREIALDIKGKRYHFNNGGSAWDTMFARRKAREETLKFLSQFK